MGGWNPALNKNAPAAAAPPPALEEDGLAPPETKIDDEAPVVAFTEDAPLSPPVGQSSGNNIGG